MAATFREIVYLVLDEIKAHSEDSDITEEHVIFLANLYRLFLLEQKRKKEGDASLSASNQLTICIHLEKTSSVPDLEYCNDVYLRSKEEIPDLLDENSVKVYLTDYFNIMTTFVTKDRFKYVGYNSYLKNIIYCTLGADNHVYFRGNNPLFLYLKQARLTGIFEDSQAAANLFCDTDENKCDILDLNFPLEADLIPLLIELIVKELLGVAFRVKDKQNDDNDNLADIASFIRRNMKSDLAKQMT